MEQHRYIPYSNTIGREPWELSVVFNPGGFYDINRTPRWPSTGSQSNPHVHLQLS